MSLSIGSSRKEKPRVLLAPLVRRILPDLKGSGSRGVAVALDWADGAG